MFKYLFKFESDQFNDLLVCNYVSEHTTKAHTLETNARDAAH